MAVPSQWRLTCRFTSWLKSFTPAMTLTCRLAFQYAVIQRAGARRISLTFVKIFYSLFIPHYSPAKGILRPWIAVGLWMTTSWSVYFPVCPHCEGNWIRLVSETTSRASLRGAWAPWQSIFIQLSNISYCWVLPNPYFLPCGASSTLLYYIFIISVT